MDIVREHLIAKHNVIATTEEIRELAKEIVPIQDDDRFAEMKELLTAQIQAVEKIMFNELTPRQAAEKYLSQWGSAETMTAVLSQYKTHEQLDQMKSMFPENFEDAVEKSIQGYKELLLDYKLAQIILPDRPNNPKDLTWKEEYEHLAIKYAKENLSEEEFIQTVNFAEIQ